VKRGIFKQFLPMGLNRAKILQKLVSKLLKYDFGANCSAKLIGELQKINYSVFGVNR